MKKLSFIILLIFALACLTGCASKAKAIKTGAVSFSAESQKTIDMLNQLVVREVSNTLIDDNNTKELFAAQIMHPNTPLDRKTIVRLMNPYQQRSTQVEQLWKDYLQNLRTIYAEYGTMFQSLDKGTVFSTEAIKEAIPLTKKLTANMVALSAHWADMPASFNSDFTTLMIQLKKVRSDQIATDEVKTLKVMNIYKQLDQLMKSETRMTQDIVEQGYKSALLGQALTRLLIDYDKLTIDDINESLAKIFELAGHVPGLELGKFQTRTEAIIAELNKDPDGKNFLNQALQAMQK